MAARTTSSALAVPTHMTAALRATGYNSLNIAVKASSPSGLSSLTGFPQLRTLGKVRAHAISYRPRKLPEKSGAPSTPIQRTRSLLPLCITVTSRPSQRCIEIFVRDCAHHLVSRTRAVEEFNGNRCLLRPERTEGSRLFR